MKPPKYLVKQRTVEAARPNQYGMKVRHGKWVTRRTFDGEQEARAYMGTLQGLYEFAVFHRGKRITGR